MAGILSFSELVLRMAIMATAVPTHARQMQRTTVEPAYCVLRVSSAFSLIFARSQRVRSASESAN